MNENEKNLSGGETAPEQPSPAPEAPAMSAAAAPQPKKSRTGLIVGVIVVIAAIAAVCIYLFAMGGGDPKETVMAAYDKSISESEAANEKLYEAIPALKAMTDLYGAPYSSSLDVTFEGMSGIEGADLVGAMLAGTGISGQVDTDPATGAFYLDGVLRLAGEDFLDLAMYLSSEEMTFSMPSLSSAVLGLNFSELENASDSEVLASLGLTAEDLGELADAMKSSASAASLDYDAIMGMADEMNAIIRSTMEAGTFTQLEDQYDMAAIQMQLTGDALSTGCKDLLHYLFEESPLAATYTELYASTGMSMEEILAEMDAALDSEEFGEFALDVVFYIDDGSIQGFTMTSNLEELTADSTSPITELKLEALPNSEDGLITFVLAAQPEGSNPVTMTMDIATVVEDSRQMADLDMNIDMGEDMGVMNFSMMVDMDANAENNLVGDLAISVEDAYTNVTLGANWAGNMAMEGDAAVVDLPQLALVVSDGTSDINIDLSAKMTYAPYDGTIAAGDYEDLLTISSDRLNEISQEYAAGLNNALMNSSLLSSLMMGAM